MRTGMQATSAVLAAMLVGCGGGQLPPIDEPPASGATGGDVDLAACPAFDEPRDDDPPPDEQPPTDPALTSPELIEDLDVGDEPPPDGEPGSPGSAQDTAEEEETPPGAAPPAPQSPMSAARAWAQREAPDAFAGVWFDNDHGAAVIAFTDDVDRYAQEIRSRFGDGWWVVAGDRSHRELERRLDALTDAEFGRIAPADQGRPGTVVGAGLREDRQLVSIDVVGGDDAALAELAARYDDPAYCFAVIDPPPEPDADGPVRTLATVAGWRDDLEVPRGALLEIAFEEETARRLVADNVPTDLPAGPDDEPWEDGRHDDLDDVDLATHVVAVYSAGRSGSCPEWVAEVSTHGDGVVVGTAVPTRGGCTYDFNPYRTVIAIERDQVPQPEALPAARDLGYDVDPDAVVVYPSEGP